MRAACTWRISFPRCPFIPFPPARAPYVRLSLSAPSWLGGPTTTECGLAAQGLEHSKACFGWLNIVLAGWLGSNQRPHLLPAESWKLEKKKKTQHGDSGSTFYWSSKHGVCSHPALPAALHLLPRSWSICKAVSSLHVCLSIPGGTVVGLSDNLHSDYGHRSGWKCLGWWVVPIEDLMLGAGVFWAGLV